MTREQLDEANAGVVRRHYRTIADQDGRIPQALLDDLAATAVTYAVQVAGEAAVQAARKRTATRKTPE